MRQFLPAAVSLTGLILASCAPSAGIERDSASTRQCFLQQQVTNFRTDSTTQSTYLKVGRDSTYELRSSGFCRGLDTTIALAIVSESGGSRICTGDWARIAIRGSMPETCRVQVVKRLTDEEIAALPSRNRP